MPRPPKPITAKNFAQLHRQLARLLADPQKVAQDINGAPELAATDFASVGDSPDRLTEWAYRWLTSPAKRRMWASLRQKAYKEKRKARVLMVSDEAYQVLKATSARENMTYSETIIYYLNNG